MSVLDVLFQKRVVSNKLDIHFVYRFYFDLTIIDLLHIISLLLLFV